MANDNQIAVKKRLIYAEDLFEPVDVNVRMVSVGGRSGGKTMAMYESLFRERVNLAPTIDPVHAAGGIYCRECENYWKNHNGYYGCTTVGDDDFCSNGTRRKENAAPD